MLPKASSIPCNHRRRQGFTLIELLVTLSVIAVLLALLLPTIAMIRSSAQSVTCANRLKHLFTNAAAWTAENRQWAPPGRWQPLLFTVNGNDVDTQNRSFQCPTYLASAGARPDPTYPTTYGLNQALYQELWIGPLSQANNYGLGTPTTIDGETHYRWETTHGRLRTIGIPSPSEVLYFSDGTPDPVNGYWMGTSEWAAGPAPLGQANYLHRGRANAVCLDGHVESADQPRLYRLFDNTPHDTP